MDADIIAAIKKRYSRQQMDDVVDILDVGVLNIYKNEILTGMKWLNSIWNEVSQKIILSCWLTTGIVNECENDPLGIEKASLKEKETAIAKFLARAAPIASRRISVSDLLYWEEGIEWTQRYLREDMVVGVLSGGSDNI